MLPLPPQIFAVFAPGWRWVRKNLLSTWLNVGLTITTGSLLIWAVLGIGRWAITQAQWAVVQVNWRLFLIGRYPVNQSWRLLLGLGLIGGGAIASRWLWQRTPQWTILAWILAFPIMLWLIGGGGGLRPVSTNLWNGLLLTLLLAVTSTVLSFPLGVLLALGRQSTLPILRWLCTAYIEIVRGVTTHWHSVFGAGDAPFGDAPGGTPGSGAAGDRWLGAL
ncbi:hypothetical protein [Neosynechococcus sphagnicola]|uniref:hypothetical protein n=1 Tax=Neosynechococcus sphagnicola TaxID=1501145 RepID=UPI000AC8DC4C|nr:hypothetical protein [Neosynechococcus sphagnicola]